jgi:DNA-binding response OmpR family regulator
MNIILAVDKDSAVHERKTAEWEKYGIDALRVDTMNEAICLLAHRDDFLFVAINEDTIPDFMPKLRIMREVTGLPVFVITSNYTIEKKLKAMYCGADVYDHFNAYVKNSVIGALEMLRAQNRVPARLPEPLRVLTGGGIILSPLRRNVFIKDIEVFLTRKEFDVLHCLMANNGDTVTHARLMKKVWGDITEWEDTDVLRLTVDRLRRKLSEISPAKEYIEIERGAGYRFLK